MKALVISGGGSKGAYGGGIAQFLIEDLKKEYDLYVGTSTGTMLIPLLAVKEIQKLKTGYTTLSQKDIFTVNPFKIKKQKNGKTKSEIDHLNVLYNLLIRRKKTFGDSSNLRKLVSKFFTEDDYNKLIDLGVEVICTVSNVTLDCVEYKSNARNSYSDFCDWMWCSGNAVPFMSLVEKDGYEYADGGFKETVSIQHAIDKGATEIDVIVLRQEVAKMDIEKVRNPFHLITRIADMMFNEISNDDVLIGQLRAKEKDVKINIYFIPRKLTNNSLIFDKETMLSWWNEGYEYAKSVNTPNRVITLCATK